MIRKVRGAHVAHSWVIWVEEHNALCLIRWPQRFLGLWILRTALDVNTSCSLPPILMSTSYNPYSAVQTLQPQCSDAWWQGNWQTPSLWVSYLLPKPGHHSVSHGRWILHNFLGQLCRMDHSVLENRGSEHLWEIKSPLLRLVRELREITLRESKKCANRCFVLDSVSPQQLSPAYCSSP